MRAVFTALLLCPKAFDVIAIDFAAFAPFVIAKVRVSGGHLCKAEAPTEPAGETQNGCGNPFLHTPCHCEGLQPRGNPFSFRGLRILSRFAFRMTHCLVIANTYGMRLHFRLPVIASEQSERGNPFLHTLVIARGFSPVAIRSLSRGLRILSCYALRMTSRLVIANTYGVRLYFRLPVIASEQSERDNPFFPPVAIRSLHSYITAFLYLINKTGVQKVYLLNSLFFTLFYHPKACFAILFCIFRSLKA